MMYERGRMCEIEQGSQYEVTIIAKALEDDLSRWLRGWERGRFRDTGEVNLSGFADYMER